MLKNPSQSSLPWSRFLRDAGAELSEHSGAAGTAALLTGVVARIGGTSAFNNYGALTWDCFGFFLQRLSFLGIMYYHRI